MKPAEATLAKLLVVDDNIPLVQNLSEILEEARYHVQTAGNCAMALQVAQNGFDVALVDLRLPDEEGTSLVPKLKELSPDSEVVLLTGFATIETAAAAVRSGAFAYLIKPCAPQNLLLTVEQALRQVQLKLEKRELQRRAQVAEKLAAVGTMTAGLSHEIRNPLNAAKLQLEVLERRLRKWDPETRASLFEPLGLVQDEIRRLDRILEDFLQFARPRELIPRAVEVPLLIAKVFDLLECDAEQRGIRIERRLQPTPPIAGDETQLRQVLMNLALNALEATASGGWIRITARPVGGGNRACHRGQWPRYSR